jgi:iron-sulfur cluster repair protein YtfE (RIC family)
VVTATEMKAEPLDPRAGAQAFFTAHHRHCDALWVDVEAAADADDAKALQQRFGAFDATVRLHLDIEEQILFPAFEEATGMHNGGPTMVMRMEHTQMRGVLDQMAAAAGRGEGDAVVDQGDTLMMLIQQHNVKEEGMLYPMVERALGGEWEALSAKIAARLAR